MASEQRSVQRTCRYCECPVLEAFGACETGGCPGQAASYHQEALEGFFRGVEKDPFRSRNPERSRWLATVFELQDRVAARDAQIESLEALNGTSERMIEALQRDLQAQQETINAQYRRLEAFQHGKGVDPEREESLRQGIRRLIKSGLRSIRTTKGDRLEGHINLLVAQLLDFFSMVPVGRGRPTPQEVMLDKYLDALVEHYKTNKLPSVMEDAVGHALLYQVLQGHRMLRGDPDGRP